MIFRPLLKWAMLSTGLVFSWALSKVALNVRIPVVMSIMGTFSCFFSPTTHDVCNNLVCDIFDASEIPATSPVPLSELLRTVDVHSDSEDEIIAITKYTNIFFATLNIKFQRICYNLNKVVFFYLKHILNNTKFTCHRADVHHGEPTPLIKFQRPPRY